MSGDNDLTVRSSFPTRRQNFGFGHARRRHARYLRPLGPAGADPGFLGAMEPPASHRRAQPNARPGFTSLGLACLVGGPSDRSRRRLRDAEGPAADRSTARRYVLSGTAFRRIFDPRRAGRIADASLGVPRERRHRRRVERMGRHGLCGPRRVRGIFSRRRRLCRRTRRVADRFGEARTSGRRHKRGQLRAGVTPEPASPR